jgi:hypothetical protein
VVRVALTDGSNSWFDSDSATKFDEDKYHDGRNFISKATGSQWAHEELYYTKSGNWVLCEWSNYQGTKTTYTKVDESDAIDWLIRMQHFENELLSKLPEKIQETIQAAFASSEI